MDVPQVHYDLDAGSGGVLVDGGSRGSHGERLAADGPERGKGTQATPAAKSPNR